MLHLNLAVAVEDRPTISEIGISDGIPKRLHPPLGRHALLKNPHHHAQENTQELRTNNAQAEHVRRTSNAVFSPKTHSVTGFQTANEQKRLKPQSGHVLPAGKQDHAVAPRPIGQTRGQHDGMTSQLLSFSTEAPFQCLPLTAALRRFVQVHGERDGAVVVSGQHTTTAVIINEMEERLLMDLKRWLSQVAPPGDGWKHDDLHLRMGIPDDEPRNAHAHLQALLLGNQVIVNVCNGELQLGHYQDVLLVELDGPRQRKVSLQWLSA